MLRLGLLAILPALANCESRPATGQPAANAPALVPVPHPATPPTPLGPAPISAPAAPDTVQLLTEQLREVAPGLVVEVQGVPVNDDPAAVPRRILTIRRKGKLLYADTTADFLYPAPNDAGTRLYPRWVPTGAGRGELLVRVATPPDFDIVRRFVVAGSHVTCRDTLPAFDEPARNLDQDTTLEFSGYRQSGEEWTDNQGQHWVAYNPRLYYEIRSTGLVLDSALTRHKALARYGTFRGFGYSDKPGIRVKP